MNTDNMSILGLTLDYGPFGFLDGFDANHICNHSDTGGRYAYAQQPQIAYWNLFCLAQALLPLCGSDPTAFTDLSDEAQAQPAIDAAQEALLVYRDTYGEAFYARYRAKLGLTQAHDGDEALFGDLFKLLHTQRADYTLFFRHLADVRRDDTPAQAQARTVRDVFFDRDSADAGWPPIASACRPNPRRTPRAPRPCAVSTRSTCCATTWPRSPSAAPARRTSPKWRTCAPCWPAPSTTTPASSTTPDRRRTGPPRSK